MDFDRIEKLSQQEIINSFQNELERNVYNENIIAYCYCSATNSLHPQHGGNSNTGWCGQFARTSSMCNYFCIVTYGQGATSNYHDRCYCQCDKTDRTIAECYSYCRM